MYEISRRDVILSAAGAALVFGLDKRVAFIGAAQAQKAAEMKPFHKFKVGDAEITTVLDGLWEKPHDPGFIKNASVDDTKAALKAAGLVDEHVPIPFTVTVVTIGGKTTLLDSGTGGQLSPKAGRFAANLKAAGIDPAAIGTVLITHYHPDHIFGLMAKDTNAQTYPNAEIVVPAVEHKWWTDQSVFTKLPEARHGLAKRIQATLGAWKNVRQAEVGSELVPGIRMVATPGHTAGHASHVVASGGKQLVVTGDLTNLPALNVRNPGWHLAFDGDAALAEASRRKVFDQAIADKAVVIGYHWGMPGAGTLAKDGNGYAYVPVG